MSGYSCFAKYYDRLTANIDYREKAAFINRLIEKHGGKKGGILLDLACGTGSLSFEFARLGYDVIGADNSCDMLSCAMEKKMETGLPVQFVCQDMTELDMYGGTDITVCALDSLNHLDSSSRILRAFQRVQLFTKHGGLFIFDMNTPYKHKNILADNTFVYDTEDVYCVWQNEYDPHDPENRVNICLDFFEREGERYCRSGEEFSEIAPEISVVEELLSSAGFSLLEKCGEDGGAVSDTAQRIIFTAVKN